MTSRWMVERLAGARLSSRRPVGARRRRRRLHPRAARPLAARPVVARPLPQRALVSVGYVGGLRKRDGVRRLAALAALPGVRLVRHRRRAQRDWLAARLPGAVLTGPLATGDLAVALASLDVLVHPGAHETCGHVLREAAASGLPVVAARSGGAPDVVTAPRDAGCCTTRRPARPRRRGGRDGRGPAPRPARRAGPRARHPADRGRRRRRARGPALPGPPAPCAPRGQPEDRTRPGICHTPHRAHGPRGKVA